MLRFLASAALVVLGGLACASAPVAHTVPELPRVLTVGQRVAVTNKQGDRLEGTVERISQEVITLNSGGASTEIPASQVARVTRRVGHAGVGAVAGAAAGLAGGLVAEGGSKPSGSPYVDTAAATGNIVGGALLGAAVGAGVGALIRTERVIYDAAHQP